MGGSGIAGDFAAVFAEQAGRRLDVVKNYRLPRWVDADRPLVVVISYSGNTEETLDVAEQALERGLDVVGISSGGRLARSDLTHHVEVPGGNQPRASLGYLLGSLLKVLQGASVVPEIDLGEAATVTESVYDGFEVSTLVDVLEGRVGIIWAGSPLTAPVAQRWKTQINENAKAPAWWSVLPEADHNEIVGWKSLEDLTSVSLAIIPLRDRDDHPRVDARFAHTSRLTAPFVTWGDEVRSRGDGPLSRMLSLAAVADLVTLELADRYGVDPESVALIEDLKSLMRD
jgi:glucose/mannose-6-phosphate isomerase